MSIPGTECGSCGAQNPADSRFCGSCGASLERPQQCPSCGAENPAGQRFCNSCGQQLVEAPAGVEARTEDESGAARRRAQAGDRPVRRRHGLHGHGRADRPRGVASDHAALLLAPLRRRAALRGHRGQVHGRRDHGAVRGPDRARGPRPPGLFRGPSHRRARLRVRGRASPRQGAQLLGQDRDQLGRGGCRRDRGGPRAEVHRRGPHGRPGAAHGGAGGARQGLPHRARRKARRGLPRAEGPR